MPQNQPLTKAETLPESLPAPRSRNEEITTVLRDEILRGRFRAGERLPSERDLAARFDTSRGTVREALKKLEQLGIATIQAGGARVVPIENATLDVLGPLLDLQELPDSRIVDQVFEVFGVLLGLAAQAAVSRATAAQIADAKAIVKRIGNASTDNNEQHLALRELAYLFIEVSDHLVLQLVFNGLQTQFVDRIRKPRFAPNIEKSALREITDHLLSALDDRDATRVVNAMQRLDRLIRDSAHQALRAQNKFQKET